MTDETTGILCTIKKYRRRKKLSQTNLARMVGVQRQAIYDMESGRYLPNTAVALKLADALGCSVEMLFVEENATPPSAIYLLDPPTATTSSVSAPHAASTPQTTLLTPPPQTVSPTSAIASKKDSRAKLEPKPTRLALAQVRDKLIGIPLRLKPGEAFALKAADASLLPDNTIECSLSATQLAKTLLVLGCDPALGLLQDLIAKAAPVFRTHTVFASSHKSLVALNQGNAHIAATHFHSANSVDANLQAIQTLAADTRPLVIAFAIQEEGFMVAPGNPFHIRDVDSLTNPAVRFANREEGAALRQLLQNRLEERGIPLSAIEGFNTLVHSHDAGAGLILSNRADVVLGLRVIAEAHGLDFVPLAATRCDLVVPADLKDHHGVAILLNILQSADLQKELRDIPGYDPSITGKIIARR